MKQLPPIDDDVFAALQGMAEPLVDDINSVLRRLLDNYRRSGASGTGRKTAAAAEKMTMPAGRARRGTTLPDAEYEVPLLRALDALGGRVATSEATDEVGRLLADRLGPDDRDTLRSGDIRWRNRTAFARLNLVKRGEMDGSTPRGIWAITEQGRRRVREAGSA